MPERPRIERVLTIELVGGPYDGRELILSPGPDGLPVPELVIPAPASEPSVYGEVVDYWTKPEPDVSMSRYRRDAFAEARDCWIYRLVGQGPG